MVLINLALILGGIAIGLGMAEAGLMIFDPKQYIVPASDWTPEYGVIAYPDAKIINGKPGAFRYVYTTNSLRMRGALVDPESETEKVLLLGDSNIFGFGLQDDETISHRLNQLLGPDADAVNMGNGGWSLPQSVRRYIELGQQYDPDAVILHIAANDLEDHVYGINWVAFVNEDGEIELRTTPSNPAGRLRKLLPPTSPAYRFLLRRQLVLHLKGILNRYAMGVGAHADGTTERLDDDATSEPPHSDATPSSEDDRIPLDQVIVFDKAENERRFRSLLREFAALLESQGVRFIVMTDTEDVLGAAALRSQVSCLEASGLIEHVVVSEWLQPEAAYPASPQGHRFGDAAAAELAERLHELLNGSANDPSVSDHMARRDARVPEECSAYVGTAGLSTSHDQSI